MKRRLVIQALSAAGLSGALAGCGGGGGGADNGSPAEPAIDSFTSDKADYLLGEPVTLRAVFTGQDARIEPGAIAVTSGTAVTLKPAPGLRSYRLVVRQDGREAVRELTLKVAYRNVFTPLALSFGRAHHSAVAGADGRIYVLGGEGGGGASPSAVMAFDDAADRFTQAGELTSGRTGHASVVLKDGSILVVGGSPSLSGTPIAERFDPRTGQSRPTATQPLHKRGLATATRLPDGRVLLAGGRAPGFPDAGSTLDLFDPQTEQFSRLATRLQVARFGHAAILVTPNLLLLYGGVAPGGGAAAPELIDLGQFSTSTLQLPAFDPLPKFGAVAVTTAAGDTCVFGGEDFASGTPFGTVIGVAAGGLNLRLVGAMLTARTAHAAAALSDGRVLVAGGSSSTEMALASTELLSAEGSGMARGIDMLSARSYHSANLLPSGRVLVLGGVDAGGAVLRSAEIFG